MEAAIGCTSLAAVALLTRQCLHISSRAAQPHRLYQDEDGGTTPEPQGNSRSITTAKLFMNAAAAVGTSTSVFRAGHDDRIGPWSLPAAANPRVGLWVTLSISGSNVHLTNRISFFSQLRLS